MAERSRTEQDVFRLVESKIASLGLDLVDVAYVKEKSERILRIVIDKTGGVSIDDCADASTAIDPLLDGSELIIDSYTLEVSSPGIDRPLVTDRDFERNIGKLVEVHPIQIKGPKKWFEGILQYVTEDRLGILLDEPFIQGVRPRTNGQEKCFLRQDIKTVKKAVRF